MEEIIKNVLLIDRAVSIQPNENQTPLNFSTVRIHCDFDEIE